jgi:hypothetical protein
MWWKVVVQTRRLDGIYTSHQERVELSQARWGALFILVLLSVSALMAQPFKSQATSTSTFKPSDDAYVAADLNDNGTDRLGLRSLNTGNLPILKVWYAWNLTIVNKTGAVVGYIPVKILTVAYFKFNLSTFNGITSAKLNLYSQNSSLTAASRSIVAYLVTNSSWSQSTLDWNNAPGFDARENSTASVENGAKGWYTLDLTRMAQGAAGKQLSVAVTFLMLYQHNEEQVAFNSTRAAGGQPYLTVNYSGSPPSGPGALFDFGNGLTSTNLIGILLILVVGIFVVLIMQWFGRRRAPSGSGSSSELADLKRAERLAAR